MEGMFASNLTFTLEDFSNSLYQDQDYNSYSYSIWAPVNLQTDKLTIDIICEAGEFIISTYETYVDLTQYKSIVEIIVSLFYSLLRVKRAHGL